MATFKNLTSAFILLFSFSLIAENLNSHLSDPTLESLSRGYGGTATVVRGTDGRIYAFPRNGVAPRYNPSPDLAPRITPPAYRRSEAPVAEEKSKEEVDTEPVKAPPLMGLPMKQVNEIIASEYYSPRNNYVTAKEFCFLRAHKMANRLMQLSNNLKLNALGDDRVMGNQDDLIFKVIIRYPEGENWSFHIATVCKNEFGDFGVCDPIDKTLEPWKPSAWLSRFSHGNEVIQKSIDQVPDAGKCHFQYYGMQKYSLGETPNDWNYSNWLMQSDQPKLDEGIKASVLRGRYPYPVNVQ